MRKQFVRLLEIESVVASPHGQIPVPFSLAWTMMRDRPNCIGVFRFPDVQTSKLYHAFAK